MFYAVVPTDEVLNRARLQLLHEFGWRKVAIVASDTKSRVSITLFQICTYLHILMSVNNVNDMQFHYNVTTHVYKYN